MTSGINSPTPPQTTQLLPAADTKPTASATYKSIFVDLETEQKWDKVVKEFIKENKINSPVD